MSEIERLTWAIAGIRSAIHKAEKRYMNGTGSWDDVVNLNEKWHALVEEYAHLTRNDHS